MTKVTTAAVTTKVTKAVTTKAPVTTTSKTTETTVDFDVMLPPMFSAYYFGVDAGAGTFSFDLLDGPSFSITNVKLTHVEIEPKYSSNIQPIIKWNERRISVGSNVPANYYIDVTIKSSKTGEVRILQTWFAVDDPNYIDENGDDEWNNEMLIINY